MKLDEVPAESRIGRPCILSMRLVTPKFLCAPDTFVHVQL
jgi:hypothetical protein